MKLEEFAHLCNCKGRREFKRTSWTFNSFDLWSNQFFGRSFLLSLIGYLGGWSLDDLLLCFFNGSLWNFNHRLWNRLCSRFRWGSNNFCFWRSSNCLTSRRFLFIFFRWWFNYNFCLWFLNWSRFCILLWCRDLFLSHFGSFTLVGINNRGCDLDFLVYFQTLFNLSFRVVPLWGVSIGNNFVFLIRIIDLSRISEAYSFLFKIWFFIALLMQISNVGRSKCFSSFLLHVNLLHSHNICFCRVLQESKVLEDVIFRCQLI